MLWLTALAFVLSIIPGVASYLTGIRLVRLRDDPALPERLQARSALVGWITVATLVPVILMLPGSRAWKVPLVILALVVGNYPSRRRIYEEQWGLGTHVIYLVRLWVAVGGFWVLLGFAPRLVLDGGPWRWAVASVLALVLFLWSTYYTNVFVWLLRGHPFSPPPLFDRITRQARTRPPLLVRLEVPGGRIINAVALASLRRPIVAFTSSLLDILAPDEQAAIYAHEVAHLDEATPARQWRAELRNILAILIATVVPAARPHSSQIIVDTWPFILLAGLIYALSLSRAREERSDHRAVELCGDPEALAQALIKMTSFARMPRRWDADLEREATHPSLARRIQAIRRRTGPAAASMTAVAFPLGAPGRFVILGPDRITWLEGVAPGTPVDPEVLRAQAARTQEILYADLLELRVTAGVRSAPRLVVTDKTGQVQTLPIPLENVSTIQGVLDRADLHLAPLPTPLRFELLVVRILLVGCLLLAIQSHGTSPAIWESVAVAALVPVPTSLAMLAAASAAQAIAELSMVPYAIPRQPATGLALVAFAVIVIWEMRRLARRAVYRNKILAVTLPLVLGVGILLATWVWTYEDSIYLDLSWGLLGVAIAVHPEAWIAPVSLAGGLWSLRSRWAKGAAGLLFVCAVMLFAIGKSLIRIP